LGLNEILIILVPVVALLVVIWLVYRLFAGRRGS